MTCRCCRGRKWVYDPHNNTAYPCAECNPRARGGEARADHPRPGATLFDDPDRFPPHTRHRKTDPDTSRTAAESLGDLRASQCEVLEALMRLGSATHEQLCEAVPGQSHSGVRTRTAELVEMGLVADAGRKARLRSGRQGIVWVPSGVGRMLGGAA